MAASNCSSTSRRFWLGRQAPARSTPDGHPPGAANPRVDLTGPVDAPIYEVQIKGPARVTNAPSRCDPRSDVADLLADDPVAHHPTEDRPRRPCPCHPATDPRRVSAS